MIGCRIYEWRTKGTRKGQSNVVVYVVSSFRKKPGALRRILKYCRSDSHKDNMTNDALQRIWIQPVLWARLNTIQGKEAAEAQQNILLYMIMRGIPGTTAK